MPAAALGLKKNLSCAVATSTSGNDEDALPSLGHAEVSAVQNSPCDIMEPEVGQRPEEDRKVLSSVGGEQSGDVLNDDPSVLVKTLVCDSGELEEQSGSGALSHARTLASDAEILARKASEDKLDLSSLTMDLLNVVVDGSVRPVPAQDLPPEIVLLALRHYLESGLLKASVKTADS